MCHKSSASSCSAKGKRGMRSSVPSGLFCLFIRSLSLYVWLHVQVRQNFLCEKILSYILFRTCMRPCMSIWQVFANSKDTAFKNARSSAPLGMLVIVGLFSSLLPVN